MGMKVAKRGKPRMAMKLAREREPHIGTTIRVLDAFEVVTEAIERVPSACEVVKSC